MFDWKEEGEFPQSQRLVIGDGDYLAEVYVSAGDGAVCSLLNQRGQRGYETIDAAKADVEAKIKADIEKRLAEAEKVVRLYGSTDTKVTCVVSLSRKLAEVVPEIDKVDRLVKRGGEPSADGTPALRRLAEELFDEEKAPKFSREAGVLMAAQQIMGEAKQVAFEMVVEGLERLKQ